MPTGRVNRGQDAKGHLAAAKEYIKIAESGDAERSAYEHAAIEIDAAMKDDPNLTQREIAKQLRKDPSFVGYLLKALRSARSTGRAFEMDWNRGAPRGARQEVHRVARERPADFVKAFEQAPASAQREIAKQISKSPAVRIEVQKREAEIEYKPNPVRKRKDLTMYQFESKLATAYGSLKQAFDLLSDVDQPGDNESIIFQIDRLRQIVDVIDEAYRTGKSLDTWAAELWEEAQ